METSFLAENVIFVASTSKFDAPIRFTFQMYTPLEMCLFVFRSENRTILNAVAKWCDNRTFCWPRTLKNQHMCTTLTSRGSMSWATSRVHELNERLKCYNVRSGSRLCSECNYATFFVLKNDTRFIRLLSCAGLVMHASAFFIICTIYVGTISYTYIYILCSRSAASSPCAFTVCHVPLARVRICDICGLTNGWNRNTADRCALPRERINLIRLRLHNHGSEGEEILLRF